MIYVVYALVAVLGTAVHLWRHPADRAAGRAVEVNDNHDPDNTGPVLYTDILFPLVAATLYFARERLRGGEPTVGPAASSSQSRR